ncbi:hypothetical protein Tco_0121008 [Tanacetum coccineum]
MRVTTSLGFSNCVNLTYLMSFTAKLSNDFIFKPLLELLKEKLFTSHRDFVVSSLYRDVGLASGACSLSTILVLDMLDVFVLAPTSARKNLIGKFQVNFSEVPALSNDFPLLMLNEYQLHPYSKTKFEALLKIDVCFFGISSLILFFGGLKLAAAPMD